MMKSSRKMQEIITALARKHGLVLTHKGAYLRLTLPPYQPLAIEVLHEHLIHVAHVNEPSPGMRLADPGIAFFTAHDQWVPIEVNQRIGGYRSYAVLSESMDDIIALLPEQQADLAGFAEMWAANIVGQGWLEDGILGESSAQAM